MAKLNILVVSRSTAVAEKLQQQLADYLDFSVRTRVIDNGHADPLYGMNELPDILLLHYATEHGELQYLANNSDRNSVPLIVCGPANNPAAMRLAMQAGARDYLPESALRADLVASLLRIREETRSVGSSGGQLVVCINGKGGSGGSFLATNLAHSLVVDAEKRVTLVDLDLQFGGLCRYLDITPKLGIVQALGVAKELDEISAAAYTCQHSSGLRLLAAPSDRLTLPGDIAVENIDALLSMFLSINDFVIVDSPNRIDAVSEYVLERADKVIVVVQQSLPYVQDTARLIKLLTRDLGIPRQRIGVVVNRYSRNAPIELDDIQKALHQKKLLTIPNQFKLATESINAGIPVADISKNAPLTKGIRNLQAQLGDHDDKPDGNLLQRALPNILRR